jgi:hypothetical protein
MEDSLPSRCHVAEITVAGPIQMSFVTFQSSWKKSGFEPGEEARVVARRCSDSRSGLPERLIGDKVATLVKV